MTFNQPLHRRPVISLLRTLDQRVIRRQTGPFVAVSHNVQSRIYKYYRKPSKVIHSPTCVEHYTFKEPEDYWLSVQRIDKWKRLDLQVEAFRWMQHEELKIVGPMVDRALLRDLPPNVTYIGQEDDDLKKDLYSHCKGFITTAIDEDFGYTPVEALASGKFVVAVHDGGYREVINDDRIGLLVDPDVDSIRNAIDRSYELHDSIKCQQRAFQFGCEPFKEKWLNYTNSMTIQEECMQS